MYLIIILKRVWLLFSYLCFFVINENNKISIFNNESNKKKYIKNNKKKNLYLHLYIYYHRQSI